MNFKKFNNKDTILVISGWPEVLGRKQNNYGIAWYTKETIEPIAKRYGQRFVVLCETNHNNEPRLFAKGKILVLRIFDQKHKSLYPRILRYLAMFNKVDRVMVHSEFCTNGGIKNFVLLIPFLFLIRVLGRKHITYFSHNVITDLSGIAPHLNLNKNGLMFKILNFGLKYFYYKMLGILCSQIVVMDDEMKRRLTGFIPQKKITSHPFWIKPNESRITKEMARKKLGIPQGKFVVLYFGFITWYKGADWIINRFSNKTFAKRHNDTFLVMAGGEAHSLKDKPYYQKYYKAQVEKAAKARNIKLTGFVNDADIDLYFKAADVAIFPYRGLIGSSGAITYAIANKVPFVLSRKMRGALYNPTYQDAMERAGVVESDIAFPSSEKGFETFVSALKNKELLGKLSVVSSEILEKRTFEESISRYYDEIFCQRGQGMLRLTKTLLNGAFETVSQ